MAETNGFYFPDRCYNCVFVHQALDSFDIAVDKNDKRTAGLVEELTILDGAMNPDQPLSESSIRIIERRRHAAEAIVDGLRVSRQAAIDKATMYCEGTLPIEEGELAPCRRHESLERIRRQISN
jgi:hypothetical protein